MKNIRARELHHKVLRDIAALFYVPLTEMNIIIGFFLKEMRLGLAGKESSLKMIPTFVDIPTGDEKGTFIALDLGGTNFRVLELCLKGCGEISPPQSMKFVIDRRHMTGDGKALFDFIARCIKIFLNKKRLGCAELMLGFTFSFPVEQSALASGRLLHWTKGFSAKGVVGKDVVKLLEEALVRQGTNGIRVAALANDTVGTMVALGYNDSRCDAGVILGTGTNACYRERLNRVLKWTGPSTGSMIINTEWGNFDLLRKTTYDRALDSASKNEGQQILEKMVSGMYLGELARLVVSDLAGRGEIFKQKSPKLFKEPYLFSTEFMSAIESDSSSGLRDTSRLLKKHGVSIQSLEDRVKLKRICALVSRRGARVSAAVLAAIIIQIDRKLSRSHTIAVDGSLFEKHPSFSKNMQGALREIFGVKTRRVKLTLAKDGSGKGAAVIAAIA